MSKEQQQQQRIAFATTNDRRLIGKYSVDITHALFKSLIHFWGFINAFSSLHPSLILPFPRSHGKKHSRIYYSKSNCVAFSSLLLIIT